MARDRYRELDQRGGIVGYPTYQAPQPPPRPGTVSLSSYLLWVTAAVSLLSGVLTLANVGTLTDVYSDLYEGTPGEGTESILVGASVFAVVLNILFAGGLVILSIFNNRGRNGARITTWVLGGLMLCCGGLGLASAGLTSSMNLDSGAGPSQEEIQQRLSDALPSWYEPLSLILTVISLLTILAAVILLALPASNAFFRKPAAAGFDPSLPYPAYPGQQSPYPQYPGAPPQPGAPPYPQSGPPAQPQSGPPAYPPSGPPAPPPSPSSDPWGRPEGDGEQNPPADPTSQR
jgi:hypothetical protein